MCERRCVTLLRAGTAALAMASVVLFAGCGADQLSAVATGESTLERIQREGRVRVGYANEAPYAYLDTTEGRLTGEAPEVLRAVMKTVGIAEVEGVLTEFGALIPGLRAGRFDVIAAGMYITPERCEQVLFSNPTYSIGEALIVRKGNPLDLHSYEDIARHETATLGVMAGAVERGYARKMGIPDARVIVFPEGPSGLEAVRIGRIDAFAGTSLTIHDLLTKAEPTRVERAEPFHDPVIDGELVRGFGAFCFRQDDRDLADAVNAALDGFLGSPEHMALVEPFGFTERELPGAATAEALCGL
ncbi:MAG: ectoine/hydroxyectoine ABC transporter substrate-binding protein EhuB [Candidatus Hydrogenedentes bacterium]|nr:ectoine/hydroxyectoine ABC transporter substrate-binding protein EhuB [Candidatus Hydrogenedentota bacterium]